ncbi:unnamed protein product [Somion occarium]|uniref:DUF7904 domain-containing protein n=1 Tax=Somion occarium TaxID=3059160 RepID=A0ABP1DJC7_9APHY
MSSVGGVDRASRRRTLDTSPKTESGLAEWTSKIKALQRQVDQDEEEETRRLEQEIAASRLARMRRSTGGASRAGSVDLSKTDVAASLKEAGSDHNILEVKAPSHRLQNQSDALRKLTRETPNERLVHAEPSTMSSSEKKDIPKAPISLAAFIGGRATGPRLTKHAPQQDAHDPTQFEQRTHITAPHPVFGRGGVAMPGMTKATQVPPSPGGSNGSGLKANPLLERDRRTSTPSLVKSFVERVEESHTTAQPTGGSNYAGRQRTISTLTGVHPQKSPPPVDAKEKLLDIAPGTSPVSSLTTIPSPDPGLRAVTPQGRRTPALAGASTQPTRSLSKSPLPRSSPVPIQTPPHSPQSFNSSPSKSPIITPSLSRPIQPQPRKSIGSVQLPGSQTSSAAFLKPPPSKDPTPSISRLQGRGFVQNMVRASSQLEAAAGSPGSPTPGGRNEGSRKPNVLERRQFDNAKGASSPSLPIISPKPVAMRKSHTSDASFAPVSTTPQPASSSLPKIIKPDYTGKSLKSAASSPSMSQAYTAGGRASKSEVGPDGSPRPQGLGSGSTMISYIKPTKTGDNPITPSPPSRPSSRPPTRPPSAASHSRKASPEPEADELGVRVRPRAKSIGANRGGPVREGLVDSHMTGGTNKPLSHPTKDRARKPRKAREATKVAVQETSSRASGVNGEDASLTGHGESTPFKPHVTPQANRHLPSVTPGHQLSSSPTATTDEKRDVSVPVVPSPRIPSFESHAVKSTTESSDSVPQAPKDEPILKVSPGSSHTARPISRQPGEKSPTSPVRHGRIPSTGKRATVMDVALALNEHEAQTRKVSPEVAQKPSSPVQASPPPESLQADVNEDDENYVKPDVKSLVANWGPRNIAPSQMEKRKSSYERYSAFVLPPLTEEKTPIHSPAGTLTRQVTSVPPVQEHVEWYSNGLASEPTVPVDDAVTASVEVPKQVSLEPFQEPSEEQGTLVIEHTDEPLPAVDVGTLLDTSDDVYKPDPDVNTISVEVMSIVGNTANVVNKDPSIFYDSEVLVVIHRSKAKSSGLVTTKVWSWIGNKAHVGEKEERKMQELARRYNTTRIVISQYDEPAEVAYILGGRLAVRQGTRAHWSSENTAMHVVRALYGVVYIDEVDLTVKNLCSAFAYCISLLGTVYVWYGRGATQPEREYALEYALSIAVSPDSIIELSEGENDEDEMFWMILGDREYARADYWQWRQSAPSRVPRMWRIVQQQPFAEKVTPTSVLPSFSDAVYIIDSVWEYFILIGSQARGKRSHIRLALSLANGLSDTTSLSKPFRPPVHVLIFPSQLPTDLRLALRGLDEVSLNGSLVPDHMNLVDADKALAHLQQTTWDKTLLQDPQFLPLGLDPSHAING